jgi:transposase
MARYGGVRTDAQWEKIPPLLPPVRRIPTRWRPPANARKVLEGILWILRSGARWPDLPEEFPSPSTCWLRLRDWEERVICLTICRTFLAELNQREQLDWSESFLDGSFAPAKKRARKSEKPNEARARSGWWWSTARVVPCESSFMLTGENRRLDAALWPGEAGLIQTDVITTTASQGRE